MPVDFLLYNMERINVVAEVLYDLLRHDPRAQVLTEIIIEASTAHTKQLQHNQASTDR